MTRITCRFLFFLPFLVLLSGLGIAAQAPVAPPAAVPAVAGKEIPPSYVLGPEDTITISALDADELVGKPWMIDHSGVLSLPLVGRIQASGHTPQSLEKALTQALTQFIKDPRVSVTVTEFRSQPVSVIGAVRTPGVHQLRGHKTLVEVLSMAGGLSDEAGYNVKITRRIEWGPIPLANATTDPSKSYSIAEVSTRNILNAASPAENIAIRPNDVISVPRGDLVYVIGEVNKPGGFVLRDKEKMTVLQALSMAGGNKNTASMKGAKLLRTVPGSDSRQEVALDLKRILAGKGEDVGMRPDDVLFLPTSVGKKVGVRTAEAALATLSGVVIFRGGF